jgi:enediyne biosynthesis protein E5
MTSSTSNAASRVHYYCYPGHDPRLRLFALVYFSALIACGTITGKIFLGFEQSWAQIISAVGAALVTQYLLERVDAFADRRPPRYDGGMAGLLGTFLPAWITGFSVAILIYPSGLMRPMIFAAALSICSKYVLRAPLGGARFHFFNPSNFGIGVTLVVLPWVGLAPPYHFTENVADMGNWLVPATVLATGITLHAVVTKRLPLCLAWLIGFVGQALTRAWWSGDTALPFLVPMTGAAFILFTLYMLPDPATTPLNAKRQVVFGVAVAATYAACQVFHIVYGLFFSLLTVCALRGAGIYVDVVGKWMLHREFGRSKRVAAGAVALETSTTL